MMIWTYSLHNQNGQRLLVCGVSNRFFIECLLDLGMFHDQGRCHLDAMKSENNRKTPWYLVTFKELPQKGWWNYFPIKTFKMIWKRRNKITTYFCVRTKRKIYKYWIFETFKKVRIAFLRTHPNMDSKDDKFIFHVFRICSRVLH